MKSFLLLSVIVLAMLTGILTYRLVQAGSPAAAAPSPVNEAPAVRGRDARSPSAEPAPPAQLPWEPVSPQRTREIAEKNPFNEERAYVVPPKVEAPVAAADAGTPAEAKEEEKKPEASFELVSVVIVGEKATVSLIVTAEAAAGKDERKPKKDAAPGERGIYRVDDAVGETGWKVAEIHRDHVVLTRIGEDGEVEEQKVKLDRGDEASADRREAALADEQKKMAELKAAQEKALRDSQVTREPAPAKGAAAAGGDGEATAPAAAGEPAEAVDGAGPAKKRRGGVGGRRGDAAGTAPPGDTDSAPPAPSPALPDDPEGSPGGQLPTPPGLPSG